MPKPAVPCTRGITTVKRDRSLPRSRQNPASCSTMDLQIGETRATVPARRNP
jgi:hypothetical protein